MSFQVTAVFILGVGAALLQKPDIVSAQRESVANTGVLHEDSEGSQIAGHHIMNGLAKTIARKLLEDTEPNPSDGPVNELPLPLPLPVSRLKALL